MIKGNSAQHTTYMIVAYKSAERWKVVDMLSTGLGVTDSSQHDKVVNQLDKILDDRHKIAHPTPSADPATRIQQSNLLDMIITNLGCYKAKGGTLNAEDELVLVTLRRRTHVAGVKRLTLRKGVI